MKKLIPTSLIFAAAAMIAALAPATAAQDARVAKVRALYDAAKAQAAECDEHGPESPVFLFEYVVNRNGGQYPAVGTYRSAARFYYTFSGREGNPYPDRLTYVVVETRRSNREAREEIVFDAAGAPVFYFESSEDGVETRVYFESAKAFKAIVGGADAPRTKTAALGSSAAARAARLRRLFAEALRE